MSYDRKNIQNFLQLYLVSDRYWLAGRELKEDIVKAIEGGVTFVQIREKELSHDTFVEEAQSIKQLCAAYQIPFVVNDNVQIAKEIDADGVHVGQRDADVLYVRSVLGDHKIIGVSVQSVEAALKAQHDGATYLGVGAVFCTNTKRDADNVSLETLKDIIDAVEIPVIAIGGIDENNIEELQGMGLSGIAVVSAILAKDNIYQATKCLKKKLGSL